MTYIHDNRSAEMENEHFDGCHEGETHSMAGWYCGFCEDEIEQALDSYRAEMGE